jgi:CheY-like chemotaxis protein
MNKDKLKILVVDDSHEWIKFHLGLLNNFLEKDSFSVDFEMSGKAGFSKILKTSANPYDLIISDLEMEDIAEESYAGEWFVRSILKREELKNTKILIISGSHDIDQVAKRQNVDFIPKHLLYNNPVLLTYKLEEIFNLRV